MDPNQAAIWIDRLGLPVAILIVVSFVLWKVINWMREDFKERDAQFTKAIVTVTDNHTASMARAQQECHDHQERMQTKFGDALKEHREQITQVLRGK